MNYITSVQGKFSTYTYMHIHVHACKVTNVMATMPDATDKK